MPLTRYLIKNEYGLANPELYRSADKDDPEALLEGVAMAGLVGLLRQLGDLAEFAAEMFHDLHEEVMATAARGHGLMVRIQQLEAEFPPIEKALLLQTNHSLYYSNAGVEWHPNLQMEQNLIARGDLPRFVMDSYEESRGPPRLFLLDKFDVSGAGACLKRYTDPSFFKVESLPDSLPTPEAQREKKVRKTKRKGARWRDGETPETVPASHAKLHQLFMEERIENAYNDPARRVKLKKRPLSGSPFDSKSGKSYMEKLVESPSPESKTIREVSVVPLSLKWKQDDTSESGHEVVEASTISPVKDMLQVNGRDEGEQLVENLEDLESTISEERAEVSYTSHAVVEEKEFLFNGDRKTDGSMDGYHSDEMISEAENYLDALANVESEMESDSDNRSRPNTTLDIGKGGTDSDANEDMELQAENLGSQSVGISASDDGNSSFGRSSSSLSTDGLSNMVDGTQSGGSRPMKVPPQPQSTVGDSGNWPDDQLPQSKEAFGVESKEPTVFNGTSVEDDASSDIRVASQTSCAAHLESTCTPLDAGSRSPMGSEQSEMSSDSTKSASELSGSDETRANRDVSPALASDDLPNQSEVNDMATNSVEHVAVDDLEDGHLNGCPMDMEHTSDNLEMISENGSRNEVHIIGDAAESCNWTMLRMDSPKSSLFIEEQHQVSPHAGEDGSDDKTISSALPLPDSGDEQASSAGNAVNDSMPATVVGSEKTIILAEKHRVEAVDEGNSDLDLQHERGDEVNEEHEDVYDRNLDVDLQHKGGGEEQQVPLEDQSTEDLDEGNLDLDLQPKVGDEVTEEQLVHVNEDVNEGNLDLELQHKGGDEETLQTLDGEKTDSLIYSMEAGDGESVDPIHPDIPYAGSEFGSDSGEIVQKGISLEDINDSIDESQVLVEDQKYLDEAEVSSREDNLPEEDTQKEEASCEEVTHNGEKTDGLTCDIEAVGGITVPLVLPNADGSMVDVLTQEVRAEDVGEYRASVADVGVNIGEEAPADFDPKSAADWESMALADGSTSMSASAYSSSVQIQSGFSYNIITNPTDLEQESAEHVQSVSLAASTAASKESSELPVNEPSVDLCFADDISGSLNLKAERVPSPDLLDEEEVFLHMSEATSKSDSGLQEEVQYTNSLNQEKEEGSSEKLLERFSTQQPSLMESLQGPMFDAKVDKFDLISEGGEVNLLEMPPLPPLPPVQWRTGKPQSAPSDQERKFPGLSLGLLPPLQPSLADESPQIGFTVYEAGTSCSHNPFLTGAPLSHNPFLSPTCENPAESYPCALEKPLLDKDPPVHSNDMEVKPLPGSLLPKSTYSEPAEQYSLALDTKLMQGSSPLQSEGEDTISNQYHESPVVEVAQPADQSLFKTNTEVKDDLPHDNPNADVGDSSDSRDMRQEPQKSLNSIEEENVSSTDQWALPPANNGGKPNGTLIGNIPRPPKPLIEAVAAHDRSKLRKVTERVRPQVAPKLEERDSLLQQIRTKSFNLKPAALSRPSIQQGPRTNLKVAAILEKANAIRQAFAGSDEDDDEDSWSE